jgi:ribosomal protein S18 acetylase RimI-like enzyme
MLDLHPLSEAEFQVFKDWLLEDYAHEIARNYRIPREDARKASATDIAGLLTEGLATPNHFLYHIVATAPPAATELRLLPTAHTAPDQPSRAASLGTVNLDTANLDTANLDTANLDTANLDNANRDTASRQAHMGYLWIIVDDQKRACFIAQIYLHPEFRRQGFGRKTLELLHTRMHQRGIQRINLHVFADNTTAQHLYRSLGYQTTDLNMQKWLEDESGPTSPAI